MQILFSILVALLVIFMLAKWFFLNDKSNAVLKIHNKVKSLIDFIIILLLTGLSILGCITTLNNNQIYFIVIYVAAYFFIKEIYGKIIIERRQLVFKINMQKVVEKELLFNEIFLKVDCQGERNSLKDFFNINENIKKSRWVNAYGDSAIGVLFNNQRHFFSLINGEWTKSLSYLISQLEFNANKIASVEDLDKIKLKVISNSDIAESIGYYFVPYNEKHENLKKPVVYGEVLFNLTMISGYAIGSILINLITFWFSLSLCIKIVSLFLGAIFFLEFILGIIMVVAFCVDALKSPKIVLINLWASFYFLISFFLQ